MPEFTKAFLNKFLLVLIISSTLLVPTYIGTALGFTMAHRSYIKITGQQPPSMINYLLGSSNVPAIINGYYQLHQMVQQYKQYPQN